MKFQHLPIGQRFQYEGKEYVKEGPIVAREIVSGKSRMIPRYAVLTPQGATPDESRRPSGEPLRAEAILPAFERFFAECVELIGAEADSATRSRLEAARQRFLDSL